MNILTLTTLYPNAANPTHGVFVENRLRDFLARSNHQVRVVAPVPWFPISHAAFGAYAKFAAAPEQETRHGIDIIHPRYFIPPKVGMTYAAQSLERCFLRAARKIEAAGWRIDLIDGHYLYPDGVAAARVAAALDKPLLLTARGSDVTEIAEYPRQREMILSAVNEATHVICVADALRDRLIGLGAPPEKVKTLRNGVDLELFRPLDRLAIQRKLNLEGLIVASVGHLIERKGHDLAIQTIAALPDATLIIAGDGPLEKSLRALAETEGVGSRVRFLGRLPHEALPEIYNAADVLLLASSREGWPNVLLESMACGAPAVAANIGGCAEVIASPVAGRVAKERSPAAFAAAISEVLNDKIDRMATRNWAARHSWTPTSEGLDRLVRDAVDDHSASRRVQIKPLPYKQAHKPRLLMTVDTEEAFDWSDFAAPDAEIAPPRDLAPFQAICEKWGVKPLYFITMPLLQSKATVAFFRDLVARGVADIGLHQHQWTTTDDSAFAGEYYSWQCNLPPDVEAEKIAALADMFEKAFGFRAVSHRAGRYGVSARSYLSLGKAGVLYDFSPSPAFDFSSGGGPTFIGMSNEPFIVQTPDSEIYVTPVSGARAINRTSVFLPQPKSLGFAKRPPKLGDRLTSPLRLTCEQARLGELKSLTRRLLADKTPALTFSFHSTSLTVGANPYAPNAAAVEKSLELIDDYLRYFHDELGGDFIGLDEVPALYRKKLPG